jgi:hypothetical protein
MSVPNGLSCTRYVQVEVGRLIDKHRVSLVDQDHARVTAARIRGELGIETSNWLY